METIGIFHRAEARELDGGACTDVDLHWEDHTRWVVHHLMEIAGSGPPMALWSAHAGA